MKHEFHYEDHIGLVYKVLGKNGVDNGDGILPFLNTVEKYDPDKGAFSTFYYHNLNLEKMKIYKYEHRPRRNDDVTTLVPIEDAFWIVGSPSPHRQLELRDELRTLSKDAKKLVTFLLKQTEIKSKRIVWPVPSTGTKHHILLQIKTHFHDNCGWSWRRYWEAVDEIKNLLND